MEWTLFVLRMHQILQYILLLKWMVSISLYLLKSKYDSLHIMLFETTYVGPSPNDIQRNASYSFIV